MLLSRARQHLGLIAELAGYGAWLLLDVALAGSVLGPLSGIVAAGIVLLRRGGLGPVPIAAGAVAVSIAVSGLSWLVVEEFTFSFTEQLALAILVIAVLGRCELRTAMLIAGAAAVAIVVSPLARAGQLGFDQFAVLSAMGWGGAVAIGLAAREVDTRRRAAIADVRSAERMELARELHDVVAHHVTGIVVAAQAAAAVARSSPDDVDRALVAIETAGTDALAAMRAMVGVLRGPDSDGARTPGAELREIPTLVERFDPQRRLVRLRTDPDLVHAVLPAGVAATGYRVVQEALTNVRRHAPGATAVEVDVEITDGALLVMVCNDGVPARPGTPRGGAGGVGLAGMAERLSALDGELSAGPTGPGAWRVSARLPLAPSR